MPSIGVAKTRAKILRDSLKELNQSISHAESLELIAKIHGFRNWNTLLGIMSKDNELLPTPLGWQVAGDQKQDFELGIDPSFKHNSAHPAIIRSIKAEPITGFATLMQKVKIGAYRGKRVRLTAELKCTDCKGATTIWLRADGDGTGNNLAFDNMEERTGKDGPIRGTTDWAKRSIVLDIPQTAATLNYGFYLRGNGVAWASNFELETVSGDIPVSSGGIAALDEPHNLNFGT